MLFGHHELKTGKYGLSPPKRPWLAHLLQKLLSGILLDALSRVCQAVMTAYALSQARLPRLPIFAKRGLQQPSCCGCRAAVWIAVMPFSC